MKDKKTLVVCELDQREAIEFMTRCEAEGLSVSDKLTAVAKGFSPRCSVTPCGKTRAPSTPFPRAGVVSPAAR